MGTDGLQSRGVNVSKFGCIRRPQQYEGLLKKTDSNLRVSS